jgi:hypothetical protein
MALNLRSILDPRWVGHHRAVALGLQICDITIYSQNLGSRTYNATTNTWDSSDTALWSGKARIQPLKNATSRASRINPSSVKEVEFQISFNKNTISGATAAMPDLRPGNYITVTNSPYDDNLEKFSYIVKSVVNSSNPWQRTLMTEVDMEADPDA